MDQDFFEKYYDYERNHWWFKARNKIITSLLSNFISNKNLNILNIGAATGYTSQLLEKFGHVTSIEYDKGTCLLTKQKLNIDIINASILDLPFNKDSYDLVCAFDVIEHVEDDQKAVHEMIRVCKKNGVIALTVPAFQTIWSEHDEINHHHRRYKANQIKDLFTVSKTNLLFSSYFNFFLFPPIAVFRILQAMFRNKNKEKKIKSDFSRSNYNNLLSKILYHTFIMEKWFLLKRIRFLFGASHISFFRKTEK